MELKLLSLWIKSHGVIIQMKPLRQHFNTAPFVFKFFYKMGGLGSSKVKWKGGGVGWGG